jgi:DNA-binding FadR family transcriptional regulator
LTVPYRVRRQRGVTREALQAAATKGLVEGETGGGVQVLRVL